MSKDVLKISEPDRPKDYRLAIFEEAVGRLHRLLSEDGRLIAVTGGISLVLPLELESVLRGHIGERIGLIRTDDRKNEYRIRVIR